MGLVTQLSHRAIERYYAKSLKDFQKDFSSFREFQESKLRELLAHASETIWGKEKGIDPKWTYAQFREELPVTVYSDWDELIQEQISTTQDVLCSDCDRYQPTSGSTATKKWIPYSYLLKREFDQAIGPWLGGLYRDYPQLKKGRHYWSLSWIPDDLRDQIDQLDDLDVFPWWQQWILKQTMAVPNSISYAKTSKSATLATLAWLCHRTDLTMLFVWSPTFALNLLNSLPEFQADLVNILERGEWGRWERELRDVPCPFNKQVALWLAAWDRKVEPGFLRQLWPQMTLISSWDTGASKTYAEKLKELFPHAAFQGKGLFATEAVLTIPYESDYVLAYKSHFYEFECLKTGHILPSWELQQGQLVTPIISTGSGFFRYRLWDKLEVTGFVDGCPCLKFLGRLRDVDLVGEKMSTEFAEEVFHSLQQEYPDVKGVSLFAVEGVEGPYYVGLFQDLSDEGDEFENEENLKADLDQELKKSFHYALARDLNQLKEPDVICRKEAYSLFENVARSKGMIQGDIKPEVLVRVREESLKH